MKSPQLGFTELTHEELNKVIAVAEIGLDNLKETRDLLDMKLGTANSMNEKSWKFGEPEAFFKASEKVSAAMDLLIHALERSRMISVGFTKVGVGLNEVIAELAEEAAARKAAAKEEISLDKLEEKAKEEAPGGSRLSG